MSVLHTILLTVQVADPDKAVLARLIEWGYAEMQ